MILYFSRLFGLVFARQKPAPGNPSLSPGGVLESEPPTTNCQKPGPRGLSSWPHGHALGQLLGLRASRISPLVSVPLFSLWILIKALAHELWLNWCLWGREDPGFAALSSCSKGVILCRPCFSNHHILFPLWLLTPHINIFLFRVTKKL